MNLKTTDELLKEIISKRLWYKPLAWHRNTASDFTHEFRTGKMTETRKITTLLALGYQFSNPITWKRIDTPEEPQNFCPSPSEA